MEYVPMTTNIDHLVIGAASLEQGVAYVRDELGVDIPKGGEHPLMGTHNHVMQTGSNTFIEVIAINPDAPAPSRPRWFGLDDPAIQNGLKQQPRLITWVVNTSALNDLKESTSYDIGEVTPLSRGELNWLFAVPSDGRLLGAGMLPNIMQWQTASHPSQNMADLNCRIKKLTIHHPYPDWMIASLEQINAEKLVTVKALNDGSTAYLEVEIDTDNGSRLLSSKVT